MEIRTEMAMPEENHLLGVSRTNSHKELSSTRS